MRLVAHRRALAGLFCGFCVGVIVGAAGACATCVFPGHAACVACTDPGAFDPKACASECVLPCPPRREAVDGGPE